MSFTISGKLADNLATIKTACAPIEALKLEIKKPLTEAGISASDVRINPATMQIGFTLNSMKDCVQADEIFSKIAGYQSLNVGKRGNGYVVEFKLA